MGVYPTITHARGVAAGCSLPLITGDPRNTIRGKWVGKSEMSAWF